MHAHFVAKIQLLNALEKYSTGGNTPLHDITFNCGQCNKLSNGFHEQEAFDLIFNGVTRTAHVAHVSYLKHETTHVSTQSALA